MRFMIKTIKVKKSWTTWLVNSEKVASNASRSLSVPSRSFKKYIDQRFLTKSLFVLNLEASWKCLLVDNDTQPAPLLQN